MPLNQTVAEGPLIIRTAHLRIVPRDFDSARAELDRIIAQAGGFVGRIVSSGERGNPRVIEATLRIPAPRLDETLAALRALGHVAGETREGEDVTRQSADLDSRLANARTSETRLRGLLERRTGDLADVLAVERELARVRQEIESMEAERKSLDQRVTYATVNITLSEERKAEVDLGPVSFSAQLRNAFVEGWSAALGLMLGMLLLAVRVAPTVAVLGQPQYQPMPVEEQVASIFSGTQGFVDAVEVRDVVRYEAAMLNYLRSEHGGILKAIRDTKQLDDDTAAKLKDALGAFGKQFA